MVTTGWTQVVTAHLKQDMCSQANHNHHPPSYIALAEVVGQLPQMILLGQLHSLILSAKHSKAWSLQPRRQKIQKRVKMIKQQWTTLHEQMRITVQGWWSESANIQWALMGEKASVSFYEVPRYRTKSWMRDIILLSHFSRLRLCAIPYAAAHQAPLSLGFSRQEHWSGLPFPSPVQDGEKWKGSCSVMSDS